MKKAYLKWTHQYGFRAGQEGLITGVVMCEVDGKQRLCYQVEYEDFATDTVPVYLDRENYVISTKY